jgi:hypothetical protein
MPLRHRDAAIQARLESITLACAVVVAGGLLGWSAAYAGLGGWGLLAGLMLTAIMLAWLSRRRRYSIGLIAGFAFAALVLTWPLLWLAVGYARYIITGEPIENE